MRTLPVTSLQPRTHHHATLITETSPDGNNKLLAPFYLPTTEIQMETRPEPTNQHAEIPQIHNREDFHQTRTQTTDAIYPINTDHQPTSTATILPAHQTVPTTLRLRNSGAHQQMATVPLPLHALKPICRTSFVTIADEPVIMHVNAQTQRALQDHRIEDNAPLPTMRTPLHETNNEPIMSQTLPILQTTQTTTIKPSLHP
jgi:hypothetical protein